MDSRESTPEFGGPFDVMSKPIGATCNLECEYCYYLEKAELYPDRPNFRMSEETLETFVRQSIEAHTGPVVPFAWQGGEPTLRGIDFYRTAVDLQNRYGPDGVEVINTFQTNGTRLDDEWCQFFAEEEFLVGISMDGPRDLHDRYRQTAKRGPTFDDVMAGLTLLQDHEVEYNVLCVLNDANSRHPRRVYDFFTDLGVQWIQFIPLVEPAEDEGRADSPEASDPSGRGREFEPPAPWIRERVSLPAVEDDGYHTVRAAAREAPVTARSVDPERYGRFMCEIFDQWVRSDVGRTSVRLIDQCLEIALTGRASLCTLMETCGDQLALEHTGDVYACDHYVDPGFYRGNIHDTHLGALVGSDEQRRFGTYKREGLPDRCRDCPVREYCHGGCPKNRHLRAPNGDFGLNYLCPGYRTFFTYVQPYLRLFERAVATDRPLSWVMAAVAALDERPAA